METPNPSLRDQGVQTLREGNLDRAIDLLARAVMADDHDADAKAFLGVAYSQQGLHEQAVRVLRSAVEQQPQNASHRFNLAVAQERSGDTPGAAAEYRRVLQINPEHAQARTRLQALSVQARAVPAAAPGPAPLAPGAPATGGPGPGNGRPMGGSTPAGLPGALQCLNCRQWSKPGLSCEWCSAPMRSRSGQPTAPWLQGPTAPMAEESPLVESVSVAPEMGTGEAFARRFAAAGLDGLLVRLVGMGLGLVVGGFSGATGTPGGREQAVPDAAAAAQLIASLFILVFALFYYVAMIAWRGQTIGKMVLGLRVVGHDGGNPGFGQAFVREIIGKFVAMLPLFLGYLWMLWDPKQQTWHDKMAGTHVERA